MRLLLAPLILAATASLAVAADPAEADAPKGDLAKLQGKWAAKVGPEKDVPIVVEIKGDAITVAVTYQGEKRTLSGELAIDETESPKHWTTSKFKTPNGDDVPGNRAIYKFEGEDRLILCTAAPGKDRPSEFKAGEDGPSRLTEFTRVKDKADAPASDLKKLQGKWEAKIGEDKAIPLVLEIKDDAAVATLTIDGQERTFKGEIKLDETKTPREMTWTKVKGLDGEDAPEVLSIYKLDGDTLTICSGNPGDARPSAFGSGIDGPPSLVVLRKVKDEKK